MPSSLVTAFRQQFPRGSILAEVLTIHDGLFVVRVSVLVEGAVLSQALAANNSLELAEDIACNRALERLSLLEKGESHAQHRVVPFASPGLAALGTPGPSPAPPEPVQPLVPLTTYDKGSASKTLDAEAETFPSLPSEVEPEGAKPESLPVDLPHQPTATAPPPEETPPPVLKLATPPTAKGTGAATPPPLAEPPIWDDDDELALDTLAANPIDLSDIIAQTDVELQRLGWDVNQGREFLEKKYGKRSRHDLTDEELLEFLLYLESQPLPSA